MTDETTPLASRRREMGIAMTETTITYMTEDGEGFTMTAEDCASIINAMARCRMLEVNVKKIPEECNDVLSDECCCWTMTDDCGTKVILAVDASDFICATPRKAVKKPTAARKRK